MKKMISVILSIAIIMSMFTFSVSATDNIESASAITPLFEMEISNTGEGFKITDGVANSLVDTSRGIDYTAFDNAQAATYGEHEVSGIKTPYLTFAHIPENGTAYTNTKSAIRVPLTEDIAKKDALTFETWARFDESFGNIAQWGGIAAIGQTGFNSEAGAAFALRTDCDTANKGSGMIRVYPNLGEIRNLWNTYTTTYPNGEIKDDLYYNPTGDYITDEMKAYWTDYGYSAPIRIGVVYNAARTDSSTLATESYANKWSHIVVTREWSEDDTDGVGRYITNIYVNGVSVGSSTSPASGKKGYSKSTEIFKDIIIGSAANSGASFTGDIAAFNVYEGVMDSSQALSSFLADADKFYEGFTYDSEKIFDLKINKGEAEGEYTVADANGQYGMVNGTIDTTVINNGPEPVYGEATVGSNTIPYLSFAHTPTVSGTTYTYQGENSGIRVPLKVNLAQKEAITVETWVRFDEYVALNNHYNSIFGVNNNAAPSLANKAFDLRVGGTYLEAYGASDMVTDIYASAKAVGNVNEVNKYGYNLTSLGSNSNLLHNATTQKYALSNSVYANKWSHIVLTRVWNDSNNDGLGTWTVTVYLDSVPVSAKTYPTSGEISKTSKEYNNLIIGKSSDTSFEGDIAAFTVYDKAMDADDVAERYAADASKYMADFFYDADKVFDMDIVEGETTDGVTLYKVKDKNTFKSATVMDTYSAMNGGGAYAENGVYTTDKPIYFNENGIEYLRFAHRDSKGIFKNTNAQINVKLNNKDFVDSDEMSFETWIRNNHMTNSSWTAYKIDGESTTVLSRRTLFALGDHPGHTVMTSNEAFRVTFDGISGVSYETGGLSLYNDLAASATGTLLANVSPYEAEWTHYVITRKWTPTDINEPFGAGTWTSTTYINGKDAGTTTQTVGSRTEYKDLCSAEWAVNSGVGNADYLAIGGNLDVGGHKAFAGDISTFAVYNKVLTNSEVASKYAATKDTYQPNVAHVAIKTTDPTTANSVVLAGNNYLGKAKKIQVNATLNNYNSSKALLPVVVAYDSEGYLLGLNVLDVAADDTFSDMANLTCVFDVEEYRSDIETIRVFVWDRATLEPYYNAPNLVKVP